MEDLQTLHDLTAGYSYTFDGKDVDGFVELFTKDAVFVVYRGGDEEPISC
jgi:hypothetical protein